MDLIKTLQQLGVNGHPIGDEWPTTCPIHNSSKGPNAINFSINLHKMVFKCYSGRCGISGRVEELIKMLGGRVAENISNITAKNAAIEVYTKPSIEELKQWRGIHKSLIERGFDGKFLEANLVGFNPETYRTTIPIFGFDDLTSPRKPLKDHYWGAISRSILDFDPDRYKNPKGLPKKELVYLPLVFGDKYLLVCEGQLNALMASQWGYVGVATLGSQPTGKHIEQVVFLARGLDLRIVLCYDSDEAGRKATQKFLDYYSNVLVLDWDEKLENDLCDLRTKENFDNMKQMEGLEWMLCRI